MSTSTVVADYVLANNAAMRVNCATTSELAILGLQGLGLCLGFSMDKKTIPAMGTRIAPVAYGNGSWEETKIDCNFIPGSESQKFMANASFTNATLRNVRHYLEDGCNFSAPDMIAADGGLLTGKSGLNVGGYGDPKAGSPGDVWKNTISVAPAGPWALFDVHTAPGDGDNISVTAEDPGNSGAKLTLIDGTDWGDLGFEVGDTVIVDWAESLPVYGKVESITTGDMVLEEGVGDAGDLTTSAGLDTDAAVHGATSMYSAAETAAC